MKKLSGISRVSIIVVILSLAALFFFPMWRIDLRAPQYPSGLRMSIWINNLTGDVAIINGLNHYIGMSTIRKSDFFEFIYLPIAIYIFLGLSVVTFLINRLWAYIVLTGTFLLIAGYSFLDFYKWEWHYGHSLDPEAPIKVPGMSYQPPLIGYKQLLNFEVLSQPDVAGWLYIIAGVILVAVSFYEIRRKSEWVG